MQMSALDGNTNAQFLCDRLALLFGAANFPLLILIVKNVKNCKDRKMFLQRRNLKWNLRVKLVTYKQNGLAEI